MMAMHGWSMQMVAVKGTQTLAQKYNYIGDMHLKEHHHSSHTLPLDVVHLRASAPAGPSADHGQLCVSRLRADHRGGEHHWCHAVGHVFCDAAHAIRHLC
jgi:hypothetical protein